MPRALSPAAIVAILAHSTAEKFISLLTLSHSTFGTRRYANTTTDFTSRGNVFTAFPFLARLQDPILGEGDLVMDATDQSVMAAIRGASYPRPTALFEVVLRSAPDTVIGSISQDVLGSPAYGLRNVEVRVGLEGYLSEAFTQEVHTPARFPDMFKT